MKKLLITTIEHAAETTRGSGGYAYEGNNRESIWDIDTPPMKQ